MKTFITNIIVVLILISCQARMEKITMKEINKRYDEVEEVWKDSCNNIMLSLYKDEGALGGHTDYALKSKNDIYFINKGFIPTLNNYNVSFEGDSAVLIYDNSNNPGVAQAQWIKKNGNETSRSFEYIGEKKSLDEIKQYFDLSDKLKLDSSSINKARGSTFKCYKLVDSRLLEIGDINNIEVDKLEDGYYYFSFPGIKVNFRLNLKDIKNGC